MSNVSALIEKERLLDASEKELTSLRQGGGIRESGGTRIYMSSLRLHEGIFFAAANNEQGRVIVLASRNGLPGDIAGVDSTEGGVSYRVCEADWETYTSLKQRFPFIEPVSLREKRTTIGCGDRLGLATPGHIRAVGKFSASPVLAQQSIRELNLTGRNYRGVVADAAFGVFQEGYEQGFGADGDHLKTLADIDVALDAGMPMITLDLTEVMNPEPAEWSDSKVEEEFADIQDPIKSRISEAHAGKTHILGDHKISLSQVEARRCCLMYWKALDFSREVDRHLREKRGDSYDLEISIDETTAPTLPSHHLFIVRELEAREVRVNSLAPRFIGEFQKGIDYIGDLGEFERQFAVHSAIAKAHGDYKISIHSGSDKFSAYPAIGKHTGMRVHLKTAGTSWLEAIRTISRVNTDLYRLMHSKAFDYFQEATKLYHITADLGKIANLETKPDEELDCYLTRDESRQLLHITYGGLLKDPEVRGPFFETLNREEEEHYRTVEAHITKHVELLGVPVR